MKMKKRKKRLKKYIKNSIIYYAILFFVKLLRAMGRKQSITLMRLIGRIAFVVARRERQNTITHLTQAFGDEKGPDEIRELAFRVFMNISTCVADAVRLPNLSREGLDKLVSVVDFHHLTDAVAEGRGVILLTGHYGNWELMGTWLVEKEIPLKVVAKRSYDPRLDELIVSYRNEAGYSNTARGRATGAIVSRLMAGDVFGMLFDLDTKVKGEFVNFFGRPAHTAVGPAILASKLGSPIVPVFIRLKEDLTYEIRCFERIPLQKSRNPKADALENTQRCSDVYEARIREYPEQWIWMHERWKKRPPLFPYTNC